MTREGSSRRRHASSLRDAEYALFCCEGGRVPEGREGLNCAYERVPVSQCTSSMSVSACAWDVWTCGKIT